MSKDYPWGKGTPKWTRDATANDSDKSFTVPANKIWELIGIYYLLSATATVGNRVVKVSISENGTDYTVYLSAPAIAASGTGTGVMSFNGLTDDWANNFTTSQGLFRMILSAGSVIRIYDSAAVDAAADDLTVVLHYIEYDA